MPKLPTVKLQHRDGRRQNINTLDYQRDIGAYVGAGWKLIGEERGDATDQQVLDANTETKIDVHRARDPEREKKFGDKQRAADHMAHRSNIVTEKSSPTDDPEPEPIEAASETNQALVSEGSIDPDWKAWPWYKRRVYVRDITGTMPKNMEQALELMP